MDKELKEYLEKLDGRMDNLEKNMATKADLNEVKNTMATKAELGKLNVKVDNLESNMATKSDLEKVHQSLLGYLEHIDETLQEHTHNREIHVRIPAPF